MPNSAYIRINNDQHVDYFVLDAQNNVVASGSAFHDDQLPEFAPDLKTTLIIPGTQVLLLELTMPKTSRSQLEKALPFALEEQLIDDVKHLHFVAAKQDSNGNVNVAVVNKQLLKNWLQQCNAMGLYPIVVVPDYLALSVIPDAWHIYLDGERAILRQSMLQGLTIEQSQLPTILNALQEQSLENQTVAIDYDDANEYYPHEELSSTKFNVTMANEDKFCMQLFQQSLQQTPSPINLLSGDVAANKPKTTKINLWKFVAWFLLAWIIVIVASNLTQYYLLKRQLKQVNQQVTQLFKQAFPNAQTVDSPRIRIDRALKNRQTSGGVFLTLLAQAGQQVQQSNSSVSINDISFHDNTLTLNVTATDFQALANLSSNLQRQGLKVAQQNATTQGKNVSATLVIRGINNG